MSGVRPVDREDLPAVGDLYELVMRSGRRRAPPGLPSYFERTMLDQPWADPGLPSLVYEGPGGRLLGFIGSHVRRARLDGRAIRVRCAGQLVSDPAERRRGVGALLLRE